MIPSPLTPAQLAAQNLVNQLNNTGANISNILANGLPARPAIGSNPAVPAVAPADINAALGSVALAQIATLSAALAQVDTTKQATALAALQ